MRIPGLGGIPVVELGKRSVREYTDDDMMTYAAALSYHILFAMVPFLIFMVALMGFLRIPQFFDWLLAQTETSLPRDVYLRIEEILARFENSDPSGLLSLGIAAALWGASAAMRSLMKALNKAYDVEETRAMWKRYLFSVLYTLGFATLLITAAVLMVVGPEAIGWLADKAGLGSLFVTLWTWLRWPVAVVLLMLTAAILYYAAPNVDQPFRIITPGAVIAVLAWTIVSYGYSIYVTNFAHYDAVYGSLAGALLLLLYFFISAQVLLFGAEINAEIYRFTHGRPEPASGDRKV